MKIKYRNSDLKVTIKIKDFEVYKITQSDKLVDTLNEIAQVIKNNIEKVGKENEIHK